MRLYTLADESVGGRHLTPRERWIITERDGGASVKEIAAFYGMKEQAVRYVHKRAKAKIVHKIVRRLIGREGER